MNSLGCEEDDGETKVEARASGLIGSLQNGLDVFDMFTRERTVISVGEIAKHLNVHKSSASRIAATLVAAGYLRPADRSQGFQLGGKLARLGSLAMAENSLMTVSKPIMQALVDKLGETCHLGALEGNEAVTIGLSDGSFAIRLHSWVGKRSPAHLTSMGKVLLGGLSPSALEKLYPEEQLVAPTPYSLQTRSALIDHLAKVRRQGYSLDNEELEIGLRCVSAPIFDKEGRVVASLTVAGSASRIQLSNLDLYIQNTREAANQISRELGATNLD